MITLRRVRAVCAVVLVSAAAIIVPGAASAAEQGRGGDQIFVAPWGNDRWPGTFLFPFSTVQRAQKAVRERTAKMSADIVVNLRGGTHNLSEPLKLDAKAGDSGANGHRVIWQPYRYGDRNQERVEISGGKQVRNWLPAPGKQGVWQANVGNLETRQLYVNGKRAARAATDGGVLGNVTRTETGYVVDTPEPQSWRNPQDIEFVYRDLWLYEDSRCGVASITGDAKTSTITMRQPCFKWLVDLFPRMAGEELVDPNDIENSPSFLKPGSWYLDRSRKGHHVLNYVPRPGEWMWGADVVAPVLETLVSGEGVAGAPLHDVTFRGFTFAHATWLKPSGDQGFPHIYGHWYYNGGVLADPDEDPQNNDALITPGNVAFRNADRITLEGNRFTRLGGGVSLELTGTITNSEVRGNVIDNTSGGGIQLGTYIQPADNRYNKIENNWIHDIGLEYRGSQGIGIDGARDIVVAHNQVNDVPFSAISASPHDEAGGIHLLNNRLFNSVKQLADGGGIWMPMGHGTSFENGAMVSGNVIHGTLNTTVAANDPAAAALYPDIWADYITFTKNVTYNNNHSFGGVEPLTMRFHNNFWDDDKVVWWPPDGEWGEDVEIRDNTLLAKDKPLESCKAIAACAEIEKNAGLQPQYRHLLGTK